MRPLTLSVFPLSPGQLVNWGHPLNAGLQVWYLTLPALAGGTTLHDLLGVNNGTLTSMAFPPTSTSGWGLNTARFGGWGELRCDGTGYVNTATTGVFNFANTTFTLSIWFRTTTTGLQQYLFTKRTSPAIGGGWTVRLTPSNTLEVILTGDAGNVCGVASSQTVTDGLWHHCMAVCTTDTSVVANNAVTAYLDGVSLGSASGTVNTYTAPSSGNMLLGTRQDIGRFFTGSLDDARLWNYGLSAEAVVAVYLNSRQGYPGVLQRFVPPTPQQLASSPGVLQPTLMAPPNQTTPWAWQNVPF